METSNQLQRVETGAMQQGNPNESYGLAEVVAQKRLINELLKTVMRKDVHFGTIPGCGDKYALLKPGAESIGFTFRLAAYYEITKRELPNGHCDIQVVCTLRNIVTGQVWGQGIGSCTSMENKYRFQTKNTGKAVPEEYWRTRDKELLGGPQYAPKKVGGSYVIVETIETENPMDKNNTFLKIAKKRAHVDAILTATAASDIFVNDEELEQDDDSGTLPTESEGHQHSPSDDSKPKAAPTSGRAKQNAPAANVGVNSATPESVGDWREVVIGWGQRKGQKLGDLAKGQVWWFATKWDCQRDANGKIKNPDDAKLKAAAEAGLAELDKAEKEQEEERGGGPMP